MIIIVSLNSGDIVVGETESEEYQTDADLVLINPMYIIQTTFDSVIGFNLESMLGFSKGDRVVLKQRDIIAHSEAADELQAYFEVAKEYQAQVIKPGMMRQVTISTKGMKAALKEREEMGDDEDYSGFSKRSRFSRSRKLN